MGPKILYVSGSLGLGHVTRDLSIANEMRKMWPEIDIHWIAGTPASDALIAAGEKLAPEYARYHSETDLAEQVSRNGRLSITAYVYKALTAWFGNAQLVKKAAERGGFDVIVGNETYEIPMTNVFGIHKLPPVPFIMMYDFLGMDVTSGNFFEKLGAWMLNLLWSNEWRVTRKGRNVAIFFGELQDIPDRTFGPLLANRRRYAETHFEFVGYPIAFNINDVPTKKFLRSELGYGDEPLIICTIGGTSVGRNLLELCGKSYPILKTSLPDLHMVVVAGPRIDPDSLDLPDGVDRRGMVPQFWRHLAACDLAVSQGGGATTLELEALRVPFLFFPVEHQAEQEVAVANRLARHGAGVRMSLSDTSPQQLADTILANLGIDVSYPRVPVDGAHLTAERILQLAGVHDSEILSLVR